MVSFCFARSAIETTEILSKARPYMIKAILKDGTSYKICNQCKYETESVESMLSHLNQHRLEEIEVNKQQTFNYERVKR